jgi:hypothetical protein
MKNIRIIFIRILILYLIFTSFLSIFAYANSNEKKDVLIQPNDIDSEWLLSITKDKDIQFNINSDLPIHFYLMTREAYIELESFPYVESDFSMNVYENINVQISSLSWTQPDDQLYYIVIFNPNSINATVTYSYAEKSSEENNKLSINLVEIFEGTFFYVFFIVYFIISIIIVVWLYKDVKKRGTNITIWVIIGFVMNIVGLLIWIIVRPSIKNKSMSKTTKKNKP